MNLVFKGGGFELTVYVKSFEVKTKNRLELINVTEQVGEIVKNSRISNGIVVIFTKHTTTGITINEYESGLLQDLLSKFSEIAPQGAGYLHDRIDNNADSHLKCSLLGNSVSAPVVDGLLSLGTWQSVLFGEFDGPKTRTILVSVTGE
ncbi:MAG: secondary thiamine-phosphate synthase enzyme YjbQ [Promethearchaeota archaeon]